jgi:hypothetical protein
MIKGKSPWASYVPLVFSAIEAAKVLAFSKAKMLQQSPSDADYTSLVIVGLGTPIELGGNCAYKGVRSFFESSPLLGFRQPVFHFFPGSSRLPSAHHFQSGELALRVHGTSPLRFDQSKCVYRDDQLTIS